MLKSTFPFCSFKAETKELISLVCFAQVSFKSLIESPNYVPDFSNSLLTLAKIFSKFDWSILKFFFITVIIVPFYL